MRHSLLNFATLCIVFQPALCRVLNDFIRHYEPLHYDHQSLMWNHHRLKRSIIGPREVELSFRAFDNNFDLVLEPERRLFHPEFKVLGGDGKPIRRHEAKGYMYSGYQIGDPQSRVVGNLAHGVFDGMVVTSHGVYHVEPAFRYAAHLNNSDSNNTFHSIIFRQSDIDHSSISGATCGSTHDEIRRTTLEHQAKVFEQEASIRGEEHVLRKRQISARDSTKVRCWLHVRLDYKLYNQLQNVDGENAMAVLLNMIAIGSRIFEDTDFDRDAAGNADNIHFGIRELIVERTRPTSGFFSNDFIGVSAFLNQHSQEDYSDFCLSYRFTYRDFDNGVVGLAYIAPQPNQRVRGGICENATSNPTQTLNTGIVTSLNYGRRIPPSLSALTFAHEAGHNFGSQHDTADPPAGGAFIMHAFATDGSEPNNDRFSPASIQMMDAVIATRGQGPGGCFVQAGDLCGNNLLDEGEECDCGPSNNWNSNGICMEDPCCLGRNCSINAGAECSPDQGPCCTPGCMFIESADNVQCAPDTDCAYNQTCNGLSAECPEQIAREVPDPPGYLLCDEEQGLCDGPTCNGTVCVAIGREPCECANETQACHVCCIVGGACTSSIIIARDDIEGLRSMLPGGMGMNRTIGTPCANFTGYCDLLNNCMPVDEDGALFRLANLFFNSELLRQFLDFASERWWVLVLGGIILLVAMFLLVMAFHCFLPRPKTVKSRMQRRQSRRASRASRRQSSQPGYSQMSQGYPQNYDMYVR